MKLKRSLALTRERLCSAGILEAPIEAEILLQHLLCMDSVQLFLEYDSELPSTQEYLLNDLLERRMSGEPLAYITGKREFYGREFGVNPWVLIPRPETEHLVEKALEIASDIDSPLIGDIGTGSGVLAVTLAMELPEAGIFASDISPEALDTACLNTRRYGVESRITFVRGDLAATLPEPMDILIANLPYVKTSDCTTSPEPRLALDGGIEGLDVIERLCGGLQGKLKPGGWVLLEIGQGQEEVVKRLLRETLPGAQIETIKDLAGIERVVCARCQSHLRH
jgi:release factor glutamine methyltransferase